MAPQNEARRLTMKCDAQVELDVERRYRHHRRIVDDHNLESRRVFRRFAIATLVKNGDESEVPRFFYSQKVD